MRILEEFLPNYSKAISVRTLIAASALPVLCGLATAGDLADITTIAVPGVAVGTLVSQRPPLRSVRAELPHTAPALGHDAYLGFGCG